MRQGSVRKTGPGKADRDRVFSAWSAESQSHRRTRADPRRHRTGRELPETEVLKSRARTGTDRAGRASNDGFTLMARRQPLTHELHPRPEVLPC